MNNDKTKITGNICPSVFLQELNTKSNETLKELSNNLEYIKRKVDKILHDSQVAKSPEK